MKYTNTIVAGAVVVAAGVGFVGGTYYQKGQAYNIGNNKLGVNGRSGQMQQMGGRNNDRGLNSGNNNNAPMMRGGNVTSGEVTSLDDKSITVKMSDGSSKIVLLSESTTYSMSEAASKDKVAVGTKVAVFGSSSNDGSLTANSIEINPTFKGQNTGNNQ